MPYCLLYSEAGYFILSKLIRSLMHKIYRFNNFTLNIQARKMEDIFLLSSIYIRRKYWIRENFRLPVFDEFTCFEMS